MRVGLVAGTGVLLVAGVLLVIPATAWLATGEPPVLSDIIVVLAGGAGERAMTAAELYAQGMGQRIMITDPSGFPDKLMEYLENEGVPSRRILSSLRPTRSTYEDALAIRQVVARTGAHSILVVTSPHHCKRARLILERMLADLDIQITVTSSVSLYMNPDRWWETRHGWNTVPLELPKLLWAWLFT